MRNALSFCCLFLFAAMNALGQTTKPDSSNVLEGVYVPSTEQRTHIRELNQDFAKKMQEVQRANPGDANKSKRKQEALKLNQERDNAIKQLLGNTSYALYKKNRFSKLENDTLKQNQAKRIQQYQQKFGLNAQKATELYTLKTAYDRQKRAIALMPMISAEEAKMQIQQLKASYNEKLKALLPEDKLKVFIKP